MERNLAVLAVDPHFVAVAPAAAAPGCYLVQLHHLFMIAKRELMVRRLKVRMICKTEAELWRKIRFGVLTWDIQNTRIRVEVVEVHRRSRRQPLGRKSNGIHRISVNNVLVAPVIGSSSVGVQLISIRWHECPAGLLMFEPVGSTDALNLRFLASHTGVSAASKFLPVTWIARALRESSLVRVGSSWPSPDEVIAIIEDHSLTLEAISWRTLLPDSYSARGKN